MCEVYMKQGGQWVLIPGATYLGRVSRPRPPSLVWVFWPMALLIIGFMFLTVVPVKAQRQHQYTCADVLREYESRGMKGLLRFARENNVTGQERRAALRCLVTRKDRQASRPVREERW